MLPKKIGLMLLPSAQDNLIFSGIKQTNNKTSILLFL